MLEWQLSELPSHYVQHLVMQNFQSSNHKSFGNCNIREKHYWDMNRKPIFIKEYGVNWKKKHSLMAPEYLMLPH